MGNTEQSGFRALGALSGLLASVIFPFLMKRMSLATMRIFGIYLQVQSLLSIPPRGLCELFTPRLVTP